jgi:hypothetical protein
MRFPGWRPTDAAPSATRLLRKGTVVALTHADFQERRDFTKQETRSTSLSLIACNLPTPDFLILHRTGC